MFGTRPWAELRRTSAHSFALAVVFLAGAVVLRSGFCAMAAAALGGLGWFTGRLAAIDVSSTDGGGLGRLRDLFAARHAREAAGDLAPPAPRFRIPRDPASAPVRDAGDEGPRVPAFAAVGQSTANLLLVEIESGGAFLRDLFATALPRIRHLRERHALLARRLAEVRRFLEGQDAGRIARERQALGDRAVATDDPTARVAYLSAMASLDACIATHADMLKDAQRIEARIASIDAAFEAARAQVARVRTADARCASGEGQALARQLSDLSEEVDALAEAVDHAFSTPSEGPQPPAVHRLPPVAGIPSAEAKRARRSEPVRES